jgi:hypothetical protein
MSEPVLTVLYRPAGQAELDLIAGSGFTAFPPRLPGQPVFYPVLEHQGRGLGLRRLRAQLRREDRVSGGVSHPDRRSIASTGFPPNGSTISTGTSSAVSRLSQVSRGRRTNDPSQPKVPFSSMEFC